MFYKPGEDTIVLVYVDDIMADGRKCNLTKFFDGFCARFKTTPVEWLTPTTPIDFNGIVVSMDDVCVYMDMQPYIAKSLRLFGMDGRDCSPLRIPMYGPIDDDTALSVDDQAEFLTKQGWCLNCLSLDCTNGIPNHQIYNSTMCAAHGSTIGWCNESCG